MAPEFSQFAKIYPNQHYSMNKTILCCQKCGRQRHMVGRAKLQTGHFTEEDCPKCRREEKIYEQKNRLIAALILGRKNWNRKVFSKELKI